MKRIASVMAVLISGCGDDDGAGEGGSESESEGEGEVPATVTFESGGHTLDVATDPFGLTLRRGDEVLTSASGDALLVGQIPVSPGVYVDPEAPPSGIAWTALGPVVAASGDTLELADGSTLRVTMPRDGVFRLAWTAAHDDAPELVRVSLGVTATERFFGFGEAWDTVSSRGVVRALQFRIDGASESGLNELHVPIPLAISPRGWGVLVETLRPGAFDVAAERDDRLAATFQPSPGEAFVVDLMGAADPLALIEDYAALTTMPALPPHWAFGPLQWRDEWGGVAAKGQDGRDVTLADAYVMRELDIPTSVIWIDNPWQTTYNSFVFDENFPDAAAMIDELRGLGYRVMLWSTPYLDSGTSDYDEARDNDYFMRLGEGLAPPFFFGNAIDFTNPDAFAFWQVMIDRVVSMGISGFKLDYAEEFVADLAGRVPDWRTFSGEDPTTLWKTYVRLFHEAYLGALPDGDGFLLTRSGGFGEQGGNTAIWPCDQDTTFEHHGPGNNGGLPAAISAGLSLSASGYPFFGSDIGGYREGLPTQELLLRWAAYAALGTIMQMGGGDNQAPWDDDYPQPETADVYRFYARLHTDLFPYLYTYARRAAETGRPVTVPLGLAFPDDEAAWSEDYEYMLGDALLVAPMFEGGASREVYLPAGTWVDYFTHEVREGPERFDMDVPLERIPLFYRAGAILPMLRDDFDGGAIDTLAEASDPGVVSYMDHMDELRVRIVPGDADSSFTAFDGTAIDVTPGDTISIAVTPGAQFADIVLEVLWPGEPAAVLVDGVATDDWTYVGGFVRVESDGVTVTIA